jgi:hypothetical protein
MARCQREEHFETHLAFPGGAEVVDIAEPSPRWKQKSHSRTPRQMIGVYGDSEGKPHGFVLDQGVVTTIDIPGATVTIPFGINNHGEIVGGFIDAGGVQHGFLAECDSKQ